MEKFEKKINDIYEKNGGEAMLSQDMHHSVSIYLLRTLLEQRSKFLKLLRRRNHTYAPNIVQETKMNCPYWSGIFLQVMFRVKLSLQNILTLYYTVGSKSKKKTRPWEKNDKAVHLGVLSPLSHRASTRSYQWRL